MKSNKAASSSPPVLVIELTWQRVLLAGMVLSGLAFQFGGLCTIQATAGMMMTTDDPAAVAAVVVSSGESVVDQWFDNIAGQGETTCRYVQDRKQSREWPDPNQGKVYFRQVTTKPPFFISVHDQSYDKLRWAHIFQKGTYYEKEVISRFEFILGETSKTWDYNKGHMPIVVDIGGNIGYYTLLSMAWKHAVVTFEINPANVMRLCESIAYNNQQIFQQQRPMNVKIHRQGVSNVTGNVLTVQVPKNPGETGLNKAQQTTNQEQEGGTSNDADKTTTMRQFIVTTTTLDDFAARHNWFDRKKNELHISLLKIDTEGHERFILAGAQRFLKANLAKNILLEYRRPCYPATLDLLDAGYRIVVPAEQDQQQYPRMLSRTASKEFLTNASMGGKGFLDLWLRLESLPLGG